MQRLHQDPVLILLLNSVNLNTITIKVHTQGSNWGQRTLL